MILQNQTISELELIKKFGTKTSLVFLCQHFVAARAPGDARRWLVTGRFETPPSWHRGQTTASDWEEWETSMAFRLENPGSREQLVFGPLGARDGVYGQWLLRRLPLDDQRQQATLPWEEAGPELLLRL